jgi:hypothetical protein
MNFSKLTPRIFGFTGVPRIFNSKEVPCPDRAICVEGCQTKIDQFYRQINFSIRNLISISEIVLFCLFLFSSNKYNGLFLLYYNIIYLLLVIQCKHEVNKNFPKKRPNLLVINFFFSLLLFMRYFILIMIIDYDVGIFRC